MAMIKIGISKERMECGYNHIEHVIISDQRLSVRNHMGHIDIWLAGLLVDSIKRDVQQRIKLNKGQCPVDCVDETPERKMCTGLKIYITTEVSNP